MDTEQPAWIETSAEPAQGGDPVCWAYLVCPDCGAVIGEGHREGCQSAAPADDRDRPGEQR